MAKSKEKIRVHNQGKREYTVPPEKKGGKKRKLEPGRAITLEKDLAEKLIDGYPDLIEFDSLVSGEKKNLSKENARLESVNETLSDENQTLRDENKALGDKVIELEIVIENSQKEPEVKKSGIPEVKKEEDKKS